MRARAAVWAVVGTMAVASAVIWYRGAGPGAEAPGEVRVPRPVRSAEGVELREQLVRVPSGVEPMRHAVEALAEPAGDDGSSALPPGTRVLSLHVRDGLALLDLSAEFAALGEAGLTGEALAQEALRRCLAQFPDVERVTVTVEGRLFEGEHSGPWSDLPVRGDDVPGDGGARP